MPLLQQINYNTDIVMDCSFVFVQAGGAFHLAISKQTG